MALSLIIGSRGLSGRLSVRNNVSNPDSYGTGGGRLFALVDLKPVNGV